MAFGRPIGQQQVKLRCVDSDSRSVVFHAGILAGKEIVVVCARDGSPAETFDDHPTREEQFRRHTRAEKTIGEPFRRLPGDVPPHKIVGELANGGKVPVEAVEMVWNDAHTIDAICGQGHYERVMPNIEREILAMARKLYEAAEVVQ